MTDIPNEDQYQGTPAAQDDGAQPQPPELERRSFAMDVAANLTADGLAAGLMIGGRYLANKVHAADAAADAAIEPPPEDAAPDDGGFLDG